MEPDRYQKNHLLFILGIIFLLSSLILVAFSFYILPHLLWEWHYDVPEFISFWREALRERYNFTLLGASIAIFLIFISLSFICGYFSYLISNYIDNKIYDIAKPKAKKIALGRELKTSIAFGAKIFGLMLLVIMVVFMLHWLFSITPPIIS